MTEESKLKIEPGKEEVKDPLAQPLVVQSEKPIVEELKKDSEPKKENEMNLAETSFKDDTVKAKTRTVTTTIRDTWWRFVFLGICCIVLLGSYYCYDNPAPMEKKIKGVMSSINLLSLSKVILKIQIKKNMEWV